MGTTSQKLTYLNDTKTKIRDGINSIGGSLDSDDTFRSYADELESLYNDMPKVTDTGDNITLENTRKGTMSIKYKGETQQDSTTGKNKCSSVTKPANANLKFFIDKPAQTFTISFTTNEALSSNSLYLEVDGTSYGNIGGITASANTRATKTYTLSNENYQAIQSGTTIDLLLYKNGANFTIPTDAMVENGDQVSSYEPYTNGASPNPDYPQEIHNVSGDNTIEICGKNLSIKNVKGYFSSNSTKIAVDGNSESFVFYATQGQTYTYSSLEAMDRSLIAQVDTLDIVNNTPITNVRSLSGDKTFTSSFTGYCLVYVNSSLNNNIKNSFQIEKGSTSSEYEAYQGNSQLISLGVENLFDKDNVTTGYLTYLNGVDTASNWRITDYIKITPNTSYIMSGCVNGTGANPSRCYYDINKTFISGVKHGTSSTSFVDTSPNNAYYMRESIKENDLNTAMIEKGSQANSYSPYGTTPIELNKISTYQDYIYKDNDRWFLHKEIGKAQITSFNSKSGTNSNYMYSTTTIDNIKKPSGGTVVSNIMSNYFISKSPNTMYLNDTIGIGINTNGTICCGFGLASGLSTKELANTYLSSNYIVAYYPLDTPTDTEITDTTLLEQLETIKRSYNGVTNISQENNDLPFILDVSALKEWE